MKNRPQAVNLLAAGSRRLAERRIKAKLIHRGDEAAQIVAENLAQHFVLGGYVDLPRLCGQPPSRNSWACGIIPPMRRRLFTILSALSLLLCLGTCGMWARGQVVGDLWVWYDKDCNTCISRLASGAGHVRYSWQDEARLSGWLPMEGHQVVRSPDKGMNPIGSAGQPHLGVPGLRYDRYGTNAYLIDVACWLLFVLTASPPLLWFIGRRRRSSSQVGLCRVCGYDLRATPERCPECGTETKKPATATGRAGMMAQDEPKAKLRSDSSP